MDFCVQKTVFVILILFANALYSSSFSRAFFADLFVDFFSHSDFVVIAVADVACGAFFYYLHEVDSNECGRTCICVDSPLLSTAASTAASLVVVVVAFDYARSLAFMIMLTNRRIRLGHKS